MNYGPEPTTCEVFDLAPSDYLGVVGPDPHGRWVWPLARMTPGEFFHVNKADRATGSVRNYAGVYGAKCDKAFSVRANDPGKPGYTLVMCREPDTKAKSPGVVEYGTARAIIEERYGYNLDDLWDDGGFALTAPSRVEQYRAPLVFRVGEKSYGLKFLAVGFEIDVLPSGSTVYTWQRTVDTNSRSCEAARERAERKLELQEMMKG